MPNSPRESLMTTREIPMTPPKFTANQRFWVEVYNRFELDEPAMDPRQRATREYSPRVDIVKALQKPYGKARRRFLMIGTVGTGKTTELFAIAEAILPSQFVVLVDLWRHFDESVGNLAALQHVEPWEVLANVPVLKREDPKQHGSGVAFMRDLFNRRVDGLAAPAELSSPSAAIPEALLDKLAYYSGGRARDFIRLVRSVADRAFDADIPSITESVVDECIDERRRVTELGITRADGPRAPVRAGPETRSNATIIRADARVFSCRDRVCVARPRVSPG